MCNSICGSHISSNPNFLSDQVKSALIVAIALTFISLSAAGAQRRISMGPVGVQVTSIVGTIVLIGAVRRYLDTCCHTSPSKK